MMHIVLGDFPEGTHGLPNKPPLQNWSIVNNNYLYIYAKLDFIYHLAFIVDIKFRELPIMIKTIFPNS